MAANRSPGGAATARGAPATARIARQAKVQKRTAAGWLTRDMGRSSLDDFESAVGITESRLPPQRTEAPSRADSAKSDPGRSAPALLQRSTPERCRNVTAS